MVMLKVAMKVRDKFHLFDEDGYEIKHIRKQRVRSKDLYQLEYEDGSLGYASAKSNIILIQR